MATARGHEIATIDCALISITVPGQTDELVLDTASQIQVTPQIETIDPIRLIVKGILRAQKRQENILAGNAIVLTDNLFIPELVVILQGGNLEVEDDVVVSYTPPVAGSSGGGVAFTLNAYSSVYNAAGLLTGYEKIMYPNCTGVPIALSAQDGVFRVSSYTINSAPDIGQPPYRIDWIGADELPVATVNPNAPMAPPTIITGASLPSGEVGSPYNQSIIATGDIPMTFSTSVGPLPAGITLNLNSGMLSGTPTADGTFVFTVKVSNGVIPDATKEFTLVIAE